MTMSSTQVYNAGDVLTADSLTKHVTESTPTALSAAMSAAGFDITALDELAFTDAAAGATVGGRIRRNGVNLEWHNGTASGRLFFAGGTDVPVADGGTGISSGTSGGVPYFSGATTVASSGALTANAVVLGGGAGAAPTVLGSLGTTTTVLHGDATGAPTFAAVALGSDVSGDLPFANLTQGSALSVLGVTGNAAADVASIAAASDYQVLRRSGTALAFGAIDLSQSAAVTSVLDETNGGTGQSTITQGDILYGSAANTLAKLAAGTSGYFLKTQGVGANPLWALAGVNVKADSFTVTANASGARAITGVGFTPKGGVFISVATAAGAGACWGFATSTTLGGSISRFTDSDTHRVQTSDPPQVMMQVNAAVNVYQMLEFTSWDADGFTLTDSASGGGYAATVLWIVFG